ncbi:hypothetical protein NEF87_002603 [Candidatus Lokiarchaeum ossiferum]|uniref:Succinyl-CoA--3-ketoacid-CoA transferase n=1 Tax=Candidatus Lokiarchaeum ossiferum TaxID=2951803 RepID=A0ABY6HS32_9ARCH|nr:hypothetical protein NEF87_002603 [Candidatus Lokiarchaeum sp. B-35]
MINDRKEANIVIAKRVAKELKDGQVVNLGFGVPMMVPQFISKDVNVIFHSENGLVGMGADAPSEAIDKDLTNAGGVYVTIEDYGSYFDSPTSFGIVRGGHLDSTILGAFEVDQEGNLANWAVPGKFIPGMGGAMDLVTGAKQVIVAMFHTAKGSPKILKKCSLPLTGAKVVDKIITEFGLFEVTPQGLILKEIQKDSSLDEIRKYTEADYQVSPQLKRMDDGSPITA